MIVPNSDEEFIQQALRSEVTDVVMRPFTMVTLRDAMEMALD